MPYFLLLEEIIVLTCWLLYVIEADEFEKSSGRALGPI